MAKILHIHILFVTRHDKKIRQSKKLCLALSMKIIKITFSAIFEHNGASVTAIEADSEVKVKMAASACSDTFQGEIFCSDDIAVDLQQCFSKTVHIHVGGKITIHANNTRVSQGQKGTFFSDYIKSVPL